MRWEYKPKTIYNKIKKRFALFPIVIYNEWVWLEPYYSYTEEGYAGTIRFNTYDAAVEWLNEYR